MTIPVSVYRWDDESAPQIIEGTPSEWFNVLKACLIDGYGSKQGAGWNLISERVDPPHMTFQNSGTDASGGYVMFDSPDNRATAIITGQTALDYTSDVEFDRTGRQFRFGMYWGSANANLAIRQWMIIASNTGFYFFAFSEDQQVRNCIGSEVHSFYFVGDYKSTTPNDPTRFISASGDSRTGSLNYLESLGEIHLGSKSLGKVYPLDSTTTSQEIWSQSIFGTRLSPGDHAADKPDITVLSPIYLFTDSTAIRDGVLNQPLTPWCRGYLPGLYSAAQCGYGTEMMPFFKVIDNQRYWSVPYTRGSNAGSCLWLNTEAW
ncbi:hypothetical protein CWB99_15955 [Pseudoalteromonas rubra]|uniref:Uncharacterized protein n=1 Tax=Pseudoalteromonas rubra TaxID=43658 RepID=A0A5S3WL27_9GAMM|nr:hypothetical protein [Pseudoalteromonas rubra]TMP27210.1 hypothetical protein CWB99_15955 [Pseudoalteromonas rubra]TMP29506.1 hypothetical protein CWC00_19050 [Pseudoalteromonas rubra]